RLEIRLAGRPRRGRGLGHSRRRRRQTWLVDRFIHGWSNPLETTALAMGRSRDPVPILPQGRARAKGAAHSRRGPRTGGSGRTWRLTRRGCPFSPSARSRWPTRDPRDRRNRPSSDTILTLHGLAGQRQGARITGTVVEAVSGGRCEAV